MSIPAGIISRLFKGTYEERRQNLAVAFSDFLQRMKLRLVRFCRSVTPLPHVWVKGPVAVSYII